jgi:hypothetical protein
VNDEALAAGLSSFLGVVVYLYIAGRLAQRKVSAEGRVPAMQFVLFWVALGGSAILSGVLSLDAVFQTPSLALVVTFLYLEVLVVCAALWGLLCYLAYLYTGRPWIVPLSILYAVEYGLLVFYVTAGRPDGVSVSLGSVSPTYGVAVTGALEAAPILILVFPEFIGALLYFRLYFRSHDRTVRYRIGLVSGGLIAYFLFDFFDLGPLVLGGLAGVVLGRLLILLAAVIVLLAYFPPQAIRTRLGVDNITGERAVGAT